MQQESHTGGGEQAPGRVVLVTGGAGGIGKSIARRFLESDDKVALCDTGTPPLRAAADEFSAEFPNRVMTLEADVTDEHAIGAMVAEIASSWGGIDILVNNAGIQGRQAPLWELTAGEWRQLIDINLNGAFIVSRAVLPLMIKAGKGTIINMASQRGKDGAPGLTHYAASKGGLLVLTRSLARECAPLGITVHAIAPGPIASGMGAGAAGNPEILARLNVPMGRFGTADEVAELVHIMASGRISFSTGYSWDLSGGKAVS